MLFANFSVNSHPSFLIFRGYILSNPYIPNLEWLMARVGDGKPALNRHWVECSVCWALCCRQLAADTGQLRGFFKLKKFQKSEKNSEVGGWVKPQLGIFFFFQNVVFCVFCGLFLLYMFPKKMKNLIGGWIFGSLANPCFSRIFGFF